ncbi:MAG: mannose-1-phosphate guanylyltransferase [Carboxydocellales bacterium]
MRIDKIEVISLIVAVIMAGGRGERFWPKSRTHTPKQFLDLTGNGTMFQLTIQRLTPLIPPERIFVVTGKAYEKQVMSQLPLVPATNVIIEPMGRDTAACIGLAAVTIEQQYPDAVMVVLPSDHLILDNEEYLNNLRCAAEQAEKEECIVTIGINPTMPETGYGYIKSGQLACEIDGMQVLEVERFTEKPDRETAIKFLRTGKYFWNSGMFIWKVSTIRKLMEQHMPELHDRLEIIQDVLGRAEEEQVLEDQFIQMKKISIDYGVLEKTDKVYVIPGYFGWDDVGGWVALERVNQLDEEGNLITGQCISLDTQKCIVDSPKKLVATIGIEDLVIVDTEDVLLVCHKGRSQDIKKLLEKFKEKQMDSYL